MPELNGKTYAYSKEGKKKYAKDLVAKLKQKRKKARKTEPDNNPMEALSSE